jgi:hypothetical protein
MKKDFYSIENIEKFSKIMNGEIEGAFVTVKELEDAWAKTGKQFISDYKPSSEAFKFFLDLLDFKTVDVYFKDQAP